MLLGTEFEKIGQVRSKMREAEFDQLAGKFRSLQEFERSVFFSSLTVEKRNLFFLEALRQDRFILLNAYLKHLTVVEERTSLPSDAGYAVILPNGLLVPAGANKSKSGHSYCIEQYDHSVYPDNKLYFHASGGMKILNTLLVISKDFSAKYLPQFQTHVDYMDVYRRFGKVIRTDIVKIELMDRILVFSLQELIKYGFKATYMKKYGKLC